MDPQVKPKSTVTLRAKASCPSRSLSNVAIRDLTLVIVELVERGESYFEPTPTGTVCTALIGCTSEEEWVSAPTT